MKAKKSSLFLSKWSAKLLGPKMNYRLRYFHQRGHFPNLSNPKDMSEILVSQLFNQNVCVNYAPFVDKLAVRDYVRWRGLGNILLKHYGVWSRPEDVEFDKLPDKFVLKSQPYISELTFFPWGALLYSYTDEAIKLYGEKWHEWERKNR